MKKAVLRGGFFTGKVQKGKKPRTRGFDAKRKADIRTPVSGANECEGSAKRNNPSARTSEKGRP